MKWLLLGLTSVLFSACAATTASQCPLRPVDETAGNVSPVDLDTVRALLPEQNCSITGRTISAEGEQMLQLSCANGRTGFLVTGSDLGSPAPKPMN